MTSFIHTRELIPQVKEAAEYKLVIGGIVGV